MRTRLHVVPVLLCIGIVLVAFSASPAYGAVVLADSYPESNFSSLFSVYAEATQFGQSFTATGGTLDSVAFWLSADPDATGNVTANVYAHTGTFGVDGVPTGSRIARSLPVDVSTINVSPFELVTFHFDNLVQLTPGAHYVVAVYYAGPWPDPLSLGMDDSTPTHPGNAASYHVPSGTWYSQSQDLVFYVYQTPLVPVHRFYNVTNGTHFYTDSTSERDMVSATWPSVFRYEGEAYYLNPANNTTPLTRLYNRVSKSHFYTANAAEATEALTKWPTVFSLDGPTYAVNTGPVANSLPVYRFYNMRNGSHFFTASAAEADMVKATWPNVYRFEGPAFWIGQ